MTNKKAPVAAGAERNSTLGLYPKPTRRSRLDRRIKILLFSNVILIIALAIVHLDSINVQRQLSQTLWQLEEAQSENDQLQEELKMLQAEKDELQADYYALVTLLENEEPAEREICSTGTFKSWMDHDAITDESSKQWKLKQIATTDKNYGFRMVDGYILVAMGPQYGPIGSKYIIQFEDGKVINAMIGDIKHQGCTSDDGSMIEFIVDSKVMPKFLKSAGNFNQLFSGSITMIREVE